MPVEGRVIGEHDEGSKHEVAAPAHRGLCARALGNDAPVGLPRIADRAHLGDRRTRDRGGRAWAERAVAPRHRLPSCHRVPLPLRPPAAARTSLLARLCAAAAARRRVVTGGTAPPVTLQRALWTSGHPHVGLHRDRCIPHRYFVVLIAVAAVPLVSGSRTLWAVRLLVDRARLQHWSRMPYPAPPPWLASRGGSLSHVVRITPKLTLLGVDLSRVMDSQNT